MRKRSPTRSKIIKDLQSETTAVSDHITVCMLLRERTSSSTQSASFVSKTDSFKVSMISMHRVRKLWGTRQAQTNAAAVLTCKRCKTHTLSLLIGIAVKVLPQEITEPVPGARTPSHADSIISLRLLALILCSNCSNTFNKVLMPKWHHTVKLLFANSVHHFSLLKMCHGWSKHFTSRYDPSTPHTTPHTQHPTNSSTTPHATACREKREAGDCCRQKGALEVAGTVRGGPREFRISVVFHVLYPTAVPNGATTKFCTVSES